ncbi:MAG: serine/threonine-protein kinase [Anaerolineae bacterium]
MLLAVIILMIVMNTILSVFIMRRRFQEPGALVAVLLLVVFPTAILMRHAYDGLPTIYPASVQWLLGPAILLFGTYFPDGRAVPKWGPVFVAFLVALDTLYRLGVVDIFANAIIGLIFVNAFNLYPLFALLYRYFRHSTANQRQQLKWLVFGGGIALAAYTIEQMVAFVLIQTDMTYAAGIVSSLGGIFSLLTIFAPMALIGVALLSRRVWNVNFAICRTLVYGGATVALIILLGVSFFALRGVLAVFGMQEAGVALGISAVVVTLAFQPARTWLQDFVDRELYGIGIDYDKPKPTLPESSTGPLQIDRYGDLVAIGRGGMGSVYRAIDRETGAVVALKVLPDEFTDVPEFRRRFTREAQVLMRLDHPNIVRVVAAGTQDAAPYIAMEFVGGPTLKALIKEKGQLDVDQSYEVLRQVASALDYAHGQGVIHRDIKPSNIMLEGSRVVVMDFGIAKLAAAATALTATGLMGTLDTIAPEQIQVAAEVTPAADIYSLGVVAFTMLTGRLPFVNATPGALVLAHLMEPPPDPQMINERIPVGAASAVLRALAKDPNARFASAGDFAEALRS